MEWYIFLAGGNMTDDIINLPFDLYTRNLIIINLIDTVRENKKACKILDVGGRSGYIEKFIKDEDELYILDIRKSDLNEKNYFLGSITNAPFEDNFFDIVISSDLYEHLSSEERTKSLYEMLRITKNFVILAAPFYSKEIYDAEIKANNFFRELTGNDHMWLTEHIKNGLPKKEDMEKFLQDNHYNFYFLESNNIINWLLMQSLIFYAHVNPISGDKMGEVFRFYNENFIELGDSTSPAYRKIYLISKDGTLPIINLCNIRKNDCMNVIKYQRLLFLIFRNIGETAKERNIRIGYLESIMINKDIQINQLNDAVHNKDIQINQLNDAVHNKDIQINQLNIQIGSLKSILDSIYQSITWKSIMRYNSIIETLLSRNTIRRRCYDIGLVGVRTIVNEGWSVFLNKSLRFLQNKYKISKTDQIPIIDINTDFVSPLSLEKRLFCTFYSNIDKLAEIKIITATYKRKNTDIELILRLNSKNGDIIRRVKISGNKILDNMYTSFRFKPIDNSEGKRFCMEIKSIGNPSAAVWYNQDQISSKIDLYYDNRKIQGCINIQVLSDIKDEDMYNIWISKNEPNDVELVRQKNDAIIFSYRPLISIITPVYNTPPDILKSTIQSVLEQTYDNWELCIVDGFSKGKDIRNILENFSQKDSRIRVKFLDQNLGISGNSNAALQFAEGEFVALLDHDDLLTRFALFEVVKSLNQNHELDFIYSDKDMITENGEQRLQPFFKPCWSPEIMLSANYLTHLCVIRKSLLDKVGNFLSETDGAQDWDLFFRITERTKKIYHIPKVLYHWRMLHTSCAQRGAEAKPYIFDAQRIALQNHLNRCSLLGDVVLEGPLWRIKWLVSNKTKISIIISTKDNANILRQCIESILNKTYYQNFEIIIIDIGSRDHKNLKYYDELSGNQRIRVVKYDKQFNYSSVNNVGARHATGDIIIFLSDHIKVITPDWLEEIIGWIEQKDIGVVCAKILRHDRTIMSAGMVMSRKRFDHVFAGVYENYMSPFGYSEWYRDYLATNGTCMIIRQQTFQELGGFDESFVSEIGASELCLRIQMKNYRIVYTPFARLEFGDMLTERDMSQESNEARRLYNLYQPLLKKGDPYFNINLSNWKLIRMSDEENFSEKFSI